MMNKFSTTAMTDALAYTGGALLGSATSRVLYDKIPLKDEQEGKTTKSKLKRGLLIVAGMVSATMIDAKPLTGKVLQGAGMGMAATQANELIKELVKPQEGIMKVALGNPQTQTVFVETYPAEMLDTSSFARTNNNPFLASPTLQASEIFSAT